jgi:UDP-glucose 4-epimerase
MPKYLVTGGAGFIGSHLVDRLIEDGHEVIVIDDLSSGHAWQVNRFAQLIRARLNFHWDGNWLRTMCGVDTVFHLAAMARTPWCLDDPIAASMSNAHSTACVLEACRHAKVRRVVLASSNVVYAAYTPYRATKEMTEMWARVYGESYGLSTICARFSNVYGPRQSESGPSPNVFAALRKSKKEKGYMEITGDGEQSRDFTHVADIVRGLRQCNESDYRGVLDLCTGKNWTLNQVAKMFGGEVRYVPERPGDVKHIVQDPKPAEEILGWKYKIELTDGIKDCLW